MKLDGSALIGSILGGAVAGVIAGAILTVSSWALQETKDSAERQDQIQTLASLISDYEYQMMFISKGGRIQIGAKSVEVTRDEVRKAKYDDLKRQVESLLEGRATQLSYDEKRDIRLAFGLSDLYPEVRFNDFYSREMFAELEALEWLDLQYMDR